MIDAKSTTACLIAVTICAWVLTACGAVEVSSGDPQGQNRTSPLTSKDLLIERGFALLTGEAALYYMLQKNQEQRVQGLPVPHYRVAKSGGVYFLDEKGRIQWVHAPSGGLRVSREEARIYQLDQFQGYNGQQSGRNLAGLGTLVL